MSILISPLLEGGVIENNLLSDSATQSADYTEAEIDLDAFAEETPLPKAQKKKEKVIEKTYIPEQERVPEMTIEPEGDGEEKELWEMNKQELERKAKVNASFITALFCNVIPLAAHQSVRINETEILEQIQKNELPSEVLDKVVRFNKVSQERLQFPAWAKESLDTSLFELAKQKGNAVIASPTSMLWITLVAVGFILILGYYKSNEESKLIRYELNELKELNKKEKEEQEKKR